MKSVVIASLVAISAAVEEVGFEEWSTRLGRKYFSSEERKYREKLFNKNRDRVMNHNSQENTWRMSVNSFADLETAEFTAQYLGGYLPEYDNEFQLTSNGFMVSPVPLPKTVLRRLAERNSGSENPDSVEQAQILRDLDEDRELFNTRSDSPVRGRRLQELPSAFPSPSRSPSASMMPSSTVLTASSPETASVGGRNSFMNWNMAWPWRSVPAVVSPTPSPSTTPSPSASPSPTPSSSSAARPADVDWTSASGNIVSPIRSQGACGACFAFATAQTLESHMRIRHVKRYGSGKVTASSISMNDLSKTVKQYSGDELSEALLRDYAYRTLSDQQILDCGSGTCAGGGIRASWNYIIESGGLCASGDYPYTGVRSSCLESQCARVPGSRIASFRTVKRQSQQALEYAVSLGPVVAAIQADESAFMFYSGGVLDASCGHQLNHAVVVVGYGTDPTSGLDYWKIRNQWGPSWGDKGFALIGRGPQYGEYGQCGILSDATIPFLEDPV